MTSWLWWVALLMIALVISGRVPVDPIRVTPPAVHVEINGNPGVILDVSTFSPDLEGWTPGEAQLQAAEDAIPAVADDGVRMPEMEGYRQYVGIIENGERKIVINSMCDEIDGWDRQFIMVMDGGSCFWNALYNVDTGELESLIVNGEA